MSAILTPYDVGYKSPLDIAREAVNQIIRSGSGKAVRVPEYVLHPYTDQLLKELDDSGWTCKADCGDPGEGLTYDVCPKT